ncbi:MAG: rhomboid family intramembrane serine protease [Actinomycetota bacterium]
MSSNPPGTSGPVVDESDVTYCYGHPDTPTKLRCSRCDRLICGRCAIPATVGQHCPWCVAEARKSAPRVRSAMAATAPAVLAVVALSAAFFFAQQVIPGLTVRLGAIPAAIAAGQWYRLLTPMLLHAGLLHIGLNMFVLWIYGPSVEDAFGTARFVAMYVVTGFLGGAASFAFGACNSLGVGASGAIFGVVGVLLVHLYNRRRSSFVAGYMKNLMFFIGANLVLGLLLPQIDYLAHLGGLAAGIALGAGLDRPDGRPAPAPLQFATFVAVIAVGAALVLWRATTFSC